MRLLIAVLLLLSNSFSATSAENSKNNSVPIQWLSIIATESSISDALSSALKLQQSGDEKLLLVETNDCHNIRKNLYVIVAGIHDKRSLAELTIAKWKKKGVNDAYLRSCKIVVPSRLSIGIPLFDQTFMNHRIEAINWDMEDAVSRIIVLDDRWVALVVPRYEADQDDIREGLRIAVRLYNLNLRQALDLSSDCIDPEFSLNAMHVALTCVSETAATHLLHLTQLFDLTDGKRVAEKSRCTKAKFEKKHWVCQEESVDAEGVLEMKPIKLQ